MNKRIGSISYISDGEEYFVYILASDKVIEKIKETETALTCLIPDAWLTFEANLFDMLDADNSGKLDKNLGTKFKLIYEEIIENVDGPISETSRFSDDKTINGIMRIKIRDNKEIYSKYILEKNEFKIKS